MLNMFAYAVANDHVLLLQVVKRNRKSLPSDVFDRPLPEHGEMLAIHVATRKGSIGIIYELLDICDVNKVCRSTGENVLHLAVRTGGSGHFMTFLLKLAVNTDLQDKAGRTLLHLAAKNGKEAVVEAMLETVRVEVNITDKDGRTLLHWAALNGREAVVEAMLETTRVEVNLIDKDGRTPRDLAVARGYKKVAKLYHR